MNGPMTSSSAAAAAAVRDAPAPRFGVADSKEDIQKAAADFEAFFLTQVMEYMFAGISTDGPFGGGFGEGIYRSFLLKEYGQDLAKSGGIGLGDAVMKELINMQEAK